MVKTKRDSPKKKLNAFLLFNAVDPEITLIFDGKSVKRNNNEHLAIENAKLTFKISK